MPARRRPKRAPPPKVWVPRVPYRDALERVYQRASMLRKRLLIGPPDARLVEEIIALCAWHITPERRAELERRKPDVP